MILYAAHLWANRILGSLVGIPPGECDHADTSFVQEFNAAFASRNRSWIECGHYGDWWYSGGFIDSLAAHPGESRWADYAFREKLESGWSEQYGCRNDSVGADDWRLVITLGEEFLKKWPASWIAPDIRLIVAEAHETAWSLAKAAGDDEYIDWTRYTLEAPNHRTRAIELYEADLRTRPQDPKTMEIRRRLARMRIDVDTGYRKYWCFDD